MTELAQIRAALKAQLDPLNDPDSWIEVSEYAATDPAIKPIIFVAGLQDTDFLVDFADGSEITLLVQAYAGTITETGAQIALDRLACGAYAVKPLLETKAAGANYVTLGGLINDLQVTSMAGHREFPVGSTRVFGLEWTVQILLG